MSIFDREGFEDAVNHDMIIYEEVLDIIQKARLNWQNSIMNGEVEGYDKNRISQLATTINEGLVTDLKVETFKQAYLNGLEAQKERVVKRKSLTKKGHELKTVRYPPRPEMPPARADHGKTPPGQCLREASLNPRRA